MTKIREIQERLWPGGHGSPTLEEVVAARGELIALSQEGGHTDEEEQLLADDLETLGRVETILEAKREGQGPEPKRFATRSNKASRENSYA